MDPKNPIIIPKVQTIIDKKVLNLLEILNRYCTSLLHNNYIVSSKTKNILYFFYAKDISRLEKLLKINLTSWKRS